MENLTFTEKWVYTLVLSAVAGWLVVILASMLAGNTLLAFAAVTGETIGYAERSVDGAFLGFLLGLIWRVYWINYDAFADSERVTSQCEKDIETEVRVRQGSRLVYLNGVDTDAVEAIGNGVSRRHAAKAGISEHRYNKALSALKQNGITGKFDVV